MQLYYFIPYLHIHIQYCIVYNRSKHCLFLDTCKLLHLEGQRTVIFLKIGTFSDLSWITALHNDKVVYMEEGCLFVLLNNINFMNFMNNLEFSKKKLAKNLKNFFNLQIHPNFRSEERLDNLVRGRESFVGLSILLVYDLCKCSNMSTCPGSGDQLVPTSVADRSSALRRVPVDPLEPAGDS